MYWNGLESPLGTIQESLYISIYMWDPKHIFSLRLMENGIRYDNIRGARAVVQLSPTPAAFSPHRASVKPGVFSGPAFSSSSRSGASGWPEVSYRHGIVRVISFSQLESLPRVTL